MYRLLSIKQPDKVTDLVGLEIDLEGVNCCDVEENSRLMDPFILIDDGSLRNNGGELIFRQPLPYWGAASALDTLQEFFTGKEAGRRVTVSGRTSVHVHIDIRDMPKRDFYRYMLLYSIYEKIVYKYAGFSRYRK